MVEVAVELVDGAVDALDVGVLLGGGGDAEGEDFEGADLGEDVDDDGEEVGSEAGVGVPGAEVALVLRTAEAVEELAVVEAGVFLFDLVPVAEEGDGGHAGDEAADGAAVAADGEVFVGEHRGEGKAVGLLEGSFEELFGDLEADEVAVVLLRVSAVGDLGDVEAELGADVGGFVVVVGDDGAEAVAELWVLVGGDVVDGGVADDVAAVVREGTEGEGVLVGGGGLAKEGGDEVAGADVVEEVGELAAAEGVVADVLDDGAAVGEGVRLLDLVVGEVGEAGVEEGEDVREPGHVHDLLMREDGVGAGGPGDEQSEDESTEKTKTWEREEHLGRAEDPSPGARWPGVTSFTVRARAWDAPGQRWDREKLWSGSGRRSGPIWERGRSRMENVNAATRTHPLRTSVADFVAGLREMERDLITKDGIARYMSEATLRPEALSEYVWWRDDLYTRNLI